ncbi:hypothetical protein IAR55_003830 [Kwoniella newhampshirensis]|uniref:Uncharacterized protein n=1 Tax=Kwoniella newhampshirensis TaxID=1651941 RepID=A0AAW0YXK9_9TREE
MPIPPRPIPASGRTRPNQAHRSSPRPGTAVPRKSLPLTSSHNLDWRAEVALLNELGPGIGSGSGPRSVPTASSTKIGVAAAALNKKQAVDEKEVEGRREVGLEGLIMDGRGKREKRTTTATTLGFDFIPNPSILALPDDPSPINSIKPSSSLLSTSKSTLNTNLSGRGRTSPISLAGTPTTPALLAQSPSSDEEGDDDDDDDDDDWEHVQLDAAADADGKGVKEDDENVDSDGEQDVIVLGDLELELELELEEDLAKINLNSSTNDQVSNGKRKDNKDKKGGRKETISYAAVLAA